MYFIELTHQCLVCIDGESFARYANIASFDNRFFEIVPQFPVDVVQDLHPFTVSSLYDFEQFFVIADNRIFHIDCGDVVKQFFGAFGFGFFYCAKLHGTH